ncbi:MAG: hypothetical protein SFV22_15000 [Saprospiraceae bacterium]|nr:hypothetical protein [Saprospiraceae bacterium]
MQAKRLERKEKHSKTEKITQRRNACAGEKKCGNTGCTSVASLCGGTLIPVFGKFFPISGGGFASNISAKNPGG